VAGGLAFVAFGAAALAQALLAKRRIRESPHLVGTGTATAGIVIGCLQLAIGAASLWQAWSPAAG